MSLYIYEAADKKGTIIKGELEARDKAAVLDFLQRQNLIPLSLEIKGKVSGGLVLSLSLTFFERVTALDRIFLVRNLSATIRAGMSIIEALDILIADAAKKIMRDILTQAKSNLQNGQPLSATFAYYKNSFPPVFTGMIRAGETAGRLESVLDELGRHMSREHELSRKVKSALAYPILLFFGTIAVVALLLIFVLPRLAKTFKQTGVELPFITKMLIGISNAVVSHPFLDLLIIAGLVWFFTYFRKTRPGRRIFLRMIFSIPIAKEIVKKVVLIRFTRTLGNLIGSGLSIVESLQLSAEAVGNEYYKEAILGILDDVKGGLPFSKSLERRPDLFPHFLISLATVGEKTGTLERVLKTFADFYDEEVDNNLRDFTAFLEPVLLLFMGLIVGTVALSILLPIYQLVGKFA